MLLNIFDLVLDFVCGFCFNPIDPHLTGLECSQSRSDYRFKLTSDQVNTYTVNIQQRNNYKALNGTIWFCKR